jgi:hypothetical protein
MYTQYEWHRQAVAMTVNTTHRFDYFPNNGFLQALLLQIYMTPVVDARIAVEKWRLADFIDQIEVWGNDGTPIFVVPGTMLKALNWLDGIPLITNQDHNYGTSTLRWHVPILFGRHWNDKQLGLDLSKWASVQLRIKNSSSATYTTGTISCDVMAKYIRDAAASPFSGYLHKENWQQYTSVASDKKYYDLPTEQKLRRLAIQVIPDVDASMVSEATLYTVLSNLKLSTKTGQNIIYNANPRNLMYINHFDRGMDVLTGAESYHTDAYGFRNGLAQTFYKAGAYLSHDGGQSTYAPDFVPGEDSQTQTRQADGDSDQISALFAGIAPEGCLWFDWTKPDEPTNYLDTAQEKTVKLDLEIGTGAAHADATINILLDRYVPY